MMRAGPRLVTLENLCKALALLRDHRPRQIVNTLRFALHAARGLPDRVPFDPLWLVLLITARCNLRCLQCLFHCPEVGDAGAHWPEMTLELFEHILRRYPGALNITLGGGEPMLHQSFFEMVRIAAERRLKVHVPTNGSLLSGRVEELLEAPVEMLNVSLYGTDGASFARLTGGRASLFDRSLGAIAELAARRRSGGFPRVLRLSFICTADNLHQVPALVRLGESLGVDQVKLKNIHPYGTTRYDPSSCLFESQDEVRELRRLLHEEAPNVPVYLPRLYRATGDVRECTQPWRVLTIDGGGSVGPCCVRGTDRRWGRLSDLPDVWNGRIMQAARRRLRDTRRPLPPVCRHCEENVADRPWVSGRRSAATSDEGGRGR